MNTLTQVWNNTDLRKRLLWVVGLVLAYRLGAVFPAPGVNYAAVERCVATIDDGSIYSVINLFSGGALLKLSVFALGVMPFITATIIMQLLSVAIPRIEALRKEGSSGADTMNQYARYLTVGLAALQAAAVVSVARTPGALLSGCNEPLLSDTGWGSLLILGIVLTGGAIMVMWLAELITEKGVGNGASLLIFISIIAVLPSQLASVLGGRGAAGLAAVLAVAVVLIAAVTFVERGQRRIPISYTQSQGSADTYLPIKVNPSGVVPVIFASSVLFMPVVLVQLFGRGGELEQWVQTNFASGTGSVYLLSLAGLIIAFAYFYTFVTFNPEETSDNLRKSGGHIPGIRAGKPTADYLRYVTHRLLAPGSIYLVLVAMAPIIGLSAVGANNDFVLGGVSLLIVVSVGLDTLGQIKAQMAQNTYSGLLRKPRKLNTFGGNK